MRHIALVCLMMALTARGADTFTADTRLPAPTKLPSHLLTYLSQEVGAQAQTHCPVPRATDLFEGQLVSLSRSAKAYLVKPTHACLCGPDGCPMWMFRHKGSATKPLWQTHGATQLELMDQRSNGYRKLKEVGGAASHGHENVYIWDSSHYSEIYAHVWTWDAEKRCRLGVETEQLMDGKMTNHTQRCELLE